jgi:phage terminase large subunit-like protein
VLTWNASNALVSRDHQGNIRPVKATKASVFRIDGISALVTALARGMVERKPKVSSYREGPGIM